MTAIELKRKLIQQIAEIDDETFLKAIKTILDSKTQTSVLHLTKEQRLEIEASKMQVKEGHFMEQDELEREFDKWLNAK